MHNKLSIADGAMAVAGGRNIGDEYFMADEGANYIDLDVFAVGAVLPTLQRLFDLYWNSEHVYPLESIVAPSAPADERRRRLRAGDARARPGRRCRRRERRTSSASSGIAEQLAGGGLDADLGSGRRPSPTRRTRSSVTRRTSSASR